MKRQLPKNEKWKKIMNYLNSCKILDRIQRECREFGSQIIFKKRVISSNLLIILK